MKKRNVFLVMLLCVVMVFTSCGTGGTSGTAQLPAAADSGSAEEVTVDDSDVKLDTQIVTGDPAKPVAVGSEDAAESDGTAAGVTAAKAASASPAKSETAKSETAKVETASADKSATDSIIETLIEEKLNASDKADKSNISTAAESENYDANGDPNKPYDEINPEVFEDEDVKYADNAILIKFDKSFKGKLTSDLKKAGIGKLEFLFDGTDYAWYTGYILKSANLAVTMENVRAMDNVITAEYNFVSEATADTTESTGSMECIDCVYDWQKRVTEQWVLASSGIQDAWWALLKKGISPGGDSSVIVAVIDTGVDYTHPDLKANMWVNKNETSGNNRDDDGNGYTDDYYGVDITTGKGSGMDDEGHGTHVAGIIAAANNKEGVVGIAYNTKIMAIKAGDASGYFLQNNVAKAIMYAYENGADVINMSFGGSQASVAVKNALEKAYTGSVLVASAGNNGQPNESADYYPVPSPNYPAAYSFVLGVMSVGKFNTESAFSNWDTNLFNSVEYEVYAPGEQIISTLPGGRYAAMSGTSMAAAVVSAEAALLRSYFPDESQYPTKFIYGQIVSGTNDGVNCANPKKHTVGGFVHNIPGSINFGKAFTDIPTPDIGISDYTIFDTAGFSADEKNLTAGCENINNGDGIIDSGETIAIGFTLRNRWGMSKNTKVHIDADSTSAGMQNPYVEFLNNDLDYGSIGTYSENDSGKIYTKDTWTGWENPFYVRVSKDCPNEYSIRLNITVTCENGLDERDRNVYTTVGEALFTVRRGTELPGRITEDMTLTSDNYYIIPNATIIEEGATVTVEPGTKIQFWCSDPEDAYADTAITYLQVNGKFITNGTEDAPVEMFPSEWMGKYRVEIYNSGKGYTELNYTNVVNPYISIDAANNCEFSQKFERELIWYRILSSGKVRNSCGQGKISMVDAKNCAFYKLGASSGWDGWYIYGTYYECIFVDSVIQGSSSQFNNCVFYGNNNYAETNGGSVSSLCAQKGNDELTISDSLYDYENGVLYMVGNAKSSKEFEELTGMSLATIASKAELDKVLPILNSNLQYRVANVTLDENMNTRYESGKTISGDIVNDSRLKNNANIGINGAYLNIRDNKPLYLDTSTKCEGWALYQVNIPIYMENISLSRYLVDIDMKSTYQIQAEITPANANPSNLRYESSDESILTVDGSGLVTPVAIGTAQVKVYSPDKAIYNYVTINVRSVTLPTSIELTPDEMSLQVGESAYAQATLTPRYATKWEVSYESSNPEVATVDEDGKITALSTGDAVITVTGYGDIKDSMTVHCELSATGLHFKDSMYVTDLTKDDGHDFYPELSPAGTTDIDLEWESASPDICYVNESGELVKIKEGVATLKATLKGTSYSATTQIAITDNLTNVGIKKTCNEGSTYYVLLTDGSLWTWGGNTKTIKRCTFDGIDFIKDIIIWSDNVYILNIKGEVWKYSSNGRASVGTPMLTDIIALNISYGMEGSCYAITQDGGVWSWGYSAWGCLGNGTTGTVYSPIQMDISGKVVKIVNSYHNTVLLCENGDVYVLGYSSGESITTPRLILQEVVDVSPASYGEYFTVETEDGYYNFDYYGIENLERYAYTKKYPTEKYDIRYSAYIEDGKVYIKALTSDGKTYGQLGEGDSLPNEDGYYRMQGIDNAEEVYFFKKNIFVETEDGSIYAFGKGTEYELGNGIAENSSTPVKLNFGIDELSVPLALQGWNSEGTEENLTLVEDEIVLDFNAGLISSSSYGSISLKDSAGNQCMLNKTIDLDKLHINTRTPLTKGETYTLTVPAGAVQDYFQNQNELITISFTYDGETEAEPAEEATVESTTAPEEESTAAPTEETTLNAEGEPAGEPVAEPTGEAATETEGETVTGEPEQQTEQSEAGSTETTGEQTGENSAEKATTTTEVTTPTEESTTEPSTEVPSVSEENTTPEEDGSTEATTPAEPAATEPIAEETPAEPDTNEPAIPDDAAYDVVNEIVIDAEKLTARTYPTKEDIEAAWQQYVEDGLNTTFKGNAILNRLIDDDVTKWLRITAPSASEYQRIGLGGNYWGTTDEFLINKQILDYDDYKSLADINEGKYLTEAPANVWPFVANAYVMVESEVVTTVGNGKVTFAVDFNRSMDTTIPLYVTFGSSYPYADYEVEGEYKTPTHWEGTVELNTIIENGWQKWAISNGKAAGTSMKLYKDWGRFQFKIDTTAAQALIMQAEATATGIKLSWYQDEFDTMAGYNVYRATKEDGLYTKLNKTIIAADTKEWFDDTVLPGERYYYNFTVVESDMTESEPSGKITVQAYDTMAPNIYHSPVVHAFTGSKLMISATVTDNVAVDTVTLYYRTKGETEWKSKQMLSINDKYAAAIAAAEVTTKGIEYYIEAGDGQGNKICKGSPENPYEVTVQVAVDSSAKGDVDGNGVVEIKDAMMLLMAANDRLNLDPEQFARADLDDDKSLSAAEALRIIQYVNGTVTTLV